MRHLRVIDSAAEDETICLKLAISHLKDGRYREALVYCREFVPADSPRYDIVLIIGEALAGLGDHQGAVRYLHQAIAQRPNQPEPHYRLGLAFESQGLHVKALDALRRACATDGSNPRYQQGLGFVLESLGEHTLAKRCFDRAIELRG